MIGNGRLGNLFVGGLFVGDLARLDDHRGHVVLAAGGVGGVDEELSRPLRVVLAGEDPRHLVLADHGGEAVRAEEDAIAGLQLDRVHVDVDPGIDAERTRDDGSLGVDLGLLGGELAAADHLLHEAVVVGDLGELPVAGEVRARVAHVPDDQVPVRPEEAGGECRAHALELLIGLGLLEDGFVGSLDRVGQLLT